MQSVQKVLTWIEKYRGFELVAWLLAGSVALAASLITVNRFWQYDLGYYDFGIFDVALWKVAHFQKPVIDHFVVAGSINLADHFTPTLYLLAPLFWLFPHSEVLLVAQSVIVSVSAMVLFYLARSYVKLNGLAAVTLVVMYLGFTGLQNALYTDFHELTVMTLPLMLAYAAILKNKKSWFVFWFLLALGCKESIFLVGVGLAGFIYWYQPKWKKFAFGVGLFSLLYGLVVIKGVIPYLSGGIYGYAPNLPTSPLVLLSQLVWPPLKIKTVFEVFLSFGFLPLVSPPVVGIVLLNLATRFLSAGAIRWDLGMHYNAEIAPTLAIGAMLGLKQLSHWRPKCMIPVCVALMVLTLILYRLVFHGPLSLAYHPAFYETTKAMRFLDPLLAVVPPGAKVLAQNNLASRLLHQNVCILRDEYESYQADYILLDVRAGQKPANYLGIKDLPKLLENLKNDPNYTVVYATQDQYVFKRN